MVLFECYSTLEEKVHASRDIVKDVDVFHDPPDRLAPQRTNRWQIWIMEWSIENTDIVWIHEWHEVMTNPSNLWSHIIFLRRKYASMPNLKNLRFQGPDILQL
jgi:hypothetical protein